MKGLPDPSNVAEGSPSKGRASRDRALFDRIASSYARKDLYEPSRIARITRLRRTLDLCGLDPDDDILEIGCGAGFAARHLRGRFGTYTGIDYSDALIGYAAELDVGPDVAFHTADLYDWRPARTYDVIFAIGVLHHMPDIPRAMACMHDMLNPGGRLVVNEPQPGNPLFNALRKARAALDDAYSSEQEELSESELVGLFDGAGFEGIRTRGQGMLSTPFAEVMLGPRAMTRSLSAIACRIDTWLEDHMQAIVGRLAWNVIVTGRRAGSRAVSMHESPVDVD